ncbi:riboflavin biosynthesis protein RibD, partial [Cereibacter changlensis]
PETDGRIDLRAALALLAGRGLTRILCEGGAQLAASLVAGRLCDALLLFQAGKLIGAEGHPALGPLGLAFLSDAPGFRLGGTEAVGGDVMQRWLPA